MWGRTILANTQWIFPFRTFFQLAHFQIFHQGSLHIYSLLKPSDLSVPLCIPQIHYQFLHSRKQCDRMHCYIKIFPCNVLFMNRNACTLFIRLCRRIWVAVTCRTTTRLLQCFINDCWYADSIDEKMKWNCSNYPIFQLQNICTHI